MYLEKHRLDDRLAFVTGGGRGIGLATAEAMLESGARVVISDMIQASSPKVAPISRSAATTSTA